MDSARPLGYGLVVWVVVRRSSSFRVRSHLRSGRLVQYWEEIQSSFRNPQARSSEEATRYVKERQDHDCVSELG